MIKVYREGTPEKAGGFPTGITYSLLGCRGLQLTSILAITGFIIVNAVVHSHGDDDNYPQHYSSYDQHNVDPKRTALRVKCDG